MPEILTLTSPITKPSVTTYVVLFLSLDWGNSRIVVRVQGSDASEIEAVYEGATAVALMTVLNTSNLTTTSLYKRVIQKLQTDGKLPAGNITGTPS